ncbi:MAG: OmpA family protein [candidate division WOR-3 bacterium]|nr:OmpA family protein [candidate division WOR-3 bacterium]
MGLWFLVLPLLTPNREIKSVLANFSFKGETALIEDVSFACLDSLVRFLKFTDAKIEIGGHTDNVGVPVEKQRLSEARAKAVWECLKTKHHIPESKLTYKGYGPSMPIATNRTHEGRVKNNRIEIKILSPIPAANLHFLKGKFWFTNKAFLSLKKYLKRV